MTYLIQLKEGGTSLNGLCLLLQIQQEESSMSQSLPLLFSLIKVPQPFVPYPAPAVQLFIPLCLFSFPLFIGLLPYLRKYCQRTVCEKAHEKETFVWIYYVYLSHSTSKQNILNLIQKMLVSVKRIIILHFLGYDKEFQCDQVKALHREFVA